MKSLFLPLILNLLALSAHAAVDLNCSFNNNKSFEISATHMQVTKGFDDYYSEPFFTLALATEDILPANTIYNCHSSDDLNLEMVCTFNNNRTKTFEVNSISYLTANVYDYDDKGNTFETIQEKFLVNGNDIVSLLYSYKSVTCSLPL